MRDASMVQKVLVNADGGSRGNPGPAAVGIVICDDQRNQLECYKACLGSATNNVAEYMALIKALQLAAKYTRDEVHVFMDSEVVVRQMNGRYKVKTAHLHAFFEEAKRCEKVFQRVVYSNVSRNAPLQMAADQLVNEALDAK
jgi:ribonuclease HI